MLLAVSACERGLWTFEPLLPFRVVATPIDHVHELDRAEATAVMAGDLDRLDQLWDDGFIVSNTFNVIVTKPDVLGLVQAGQIAYRSLDRTTEIVRVVERDRNRPWAKKWSCRRAAHRADGETITRRYTHVWVQREDQWRHRGPACVFVIETPA